MIRAGAGAVTTPLPPHGQARFSRLVTHFDPPAARQHHRQAAAPGAIRAPLPAVRFHRKQSAATRNRRTLPAYALQVAIQGYQSKTLTLAKLAPIQTAAFKLFDDSLHLGSGSPLSNNTGFICHGLTSTRKARAG